MKREIRKEKPRKQKEVQAKDGKEEGNYIDDWQRA